MSLGWRDVSEGEGQMWFSFIKLRMNYEWTLIFRSGHFNDTLIIEEKQGRLYGITGIGNGIHIVPMSECSANLKQCFKFKALMAIFWTIQIAKTSGDWRYVSWNPGRSKQDLKRKSSHTLPWGASINDRKIKKFCKAWCIWKSFVETSVKRP